MRFDRTSIIATIISFIGISCANAQEGSIRIEPRQMIYGYNASVSLDGTYLVSGYANTLNIWQTRDGSLVKTIKGLGSSAYHTVISADNKYVAAEILQAKTVVVWEIASGTRVAEIKSGIEFINRMAFVEDGDVLLISGSNYSNGVANLAYDLRARKPISTLKISSSGGLAVSPDGRKVLLGARPYRKDFSAGICEWRYREGTCDPILGNMGFAPSIMSFDTTGRRLALVPDGGDLGLVVMDTSLWSVLFTVPKEQRSLYYTMSFTGDTIYVADSSSPSIDLYSATDGGKKKTISVTADMGFERMIQGQTPLSDSELLITFEKNVVVLDQATGAVVRQLGSRGAAMLPSAKTFGDDLTLMSSDYVYRFNVNSGEVTTSRREKIGPLDARYARVGDRILETSYSTGLIRLADPEGRHAADIPIPTKLATVDAISDDEKTVVLSVQRDDFKMFNVLLNVETNATETLDTWFVRSVFEPTGRSLYGLAQGQENVKDGIYKTDLITKKKTRIVTGNKNYSWLHYAPQQGMLVATGFDSDKNDSIFDMWSPSGTKLGAWQGRDRTWIFSFANAPSGQLLASAADGSARLLDIGSGQILKTVPDAGGAVFASNNSKLVANAPGAVKVWDAQSGALLVTFAGSGGEWVMMTPEGFFDSSSNGTSLINVVQGMRPLAPTQFFQALYRPDLVREKLAGDRDNKVSEAASKLDLAKVVESGAAPLVKILDPQTRNVDPDGRLEIEAEITSQKGGVGRTEWRVNGITAGIASSAPADTAQPYKVSQAISLEEGENVIEMIAYNSQNLVASKPSTLSLKWEGNGNQQARLFVLSVGVNEYWDSRIKLTFASGDAQSIASTFAQAGKELYQDVSVTTVIDAQATRAHLTEVFNELAGKVRPRDVFVFFLAGHGKTVDGRYFFIPQDFRYKDENSIVTDGIGQEQFQEWLAKIPAKKSILLYDTCESGTLTSDRVASRGLERVAALERMTHAMGRTVLSAATDDAPALEGYNGHGVFTYAVLEGIGNADGNGDGVIDVTELAGYVDAQVPEISQKAFSQRQVPQMRIVGSNFPLIAKLEAKLGGDSEASVPTKPTHVIIEGAEIVESPNGKAVDKLPPGTTVTLVSSADGWVLVARGGKKLGYLPEGKLVPLQ